MIYMSKFIGISEASKILNLIDPKKKAFNHPKILKQFKDIKPKKINNRKLYTRSN